MFDKSTGTWLIASSIAGVALAIVLGLIDVADTGNPTWSFIVLAISALIGVGLFAAYVFVWSFAGHFFAALIAFFAAGPGLISWISEFTTDPPEVIVEQELEELVTLTWLGFTIAMIIFTVNLGIWLVKDDHVNFIDAGEDIREDRKTQDA